jgi:outer membrane lipoprotein carrier protein
MNSTTTLVGRDRRARRGSLRTARRSASTIIAVSSVIFSSVAFGQSLSPSDITNLLARIRAARAAAPSVEADFREEKTLRLLNKPIISSGKMWFQAPDKFRREVRGTAPSLTVSNGRELWIYYPNFKSAEHYSLGKRSSVDAVIATINTALNLDNVENAFSISGAKIDNHYELALSPRAGAMKRLFEKFNLRLNQDLFAERTEMVQPNGERVVTTYSNQSRASVPASMFEFTPPTGVEISTPLGR